MDESTNKEDTQKIILDEQHPFLGLPAFKEEYKSFFFGRDDDIYQLVKLIRSYNVTVLSSISGLGKTSLINAGIIPGLRNLDFLPINLRLGFGDARKTILEGIKDNVYEQLNKIDNEVINFKDRTLWEYFHEIKILHGYAQPVLIFDQFEELFTIGSNYPEQVRDVVSELANLIENQVPVKAQNKCKDGKFPFSTDTQNFRVLISLREDYLAQLENLNNLIPSLKKSRYRLVPMNDQQALEAIIKPGRKIIEEPEAKKIIKLITDASKLSSEIKVSDKEIEIEPFLLSLVCYQINELRIRTKQEKITSVLLNNIKIETIIEDYYTKSTSFLSKKGREFLEENLLTKDDHRKLQPKSDLIKSRFIEESDIEKLIDIRVLRKEIWGGREHIEFIHDILVDTIKKHRDQRLASLNLKKYFIRITAPLIILIALISILGFLILLNKNGKIQNKDRKIQKYSNDLDSMNLSLRKRSIELTRLNIVSDSLTKAAINEKIFAQKEKDAAQKQETISDSLAKEAEKQRNIASLEKDDAKKNKLKSDSLALVAIQERNALRLLQKEYDSLIQLGNEALNKGNIEEAKKYYSTTQAKKHNSAIDSVLTDSRKPQSTDITAILKNNYPTPGSIKYTLVLKANEMDYLERESSYKKYQDSDIKSIKQHLILLFNYLDRENYTKAEKLYLQICNEYDVTQLDANQKYLLGYFGLQLNKSDPYNPKYLENIHSLFHEAFGSWNIEKLARPYLELLDMVNKNFNNYRWSWNLAIQIANIKPESFWINYYLGAFLQSYKEQSEYSEIALEHLDKARILIYQLDKKDRNRLSAWISYVKGFTYYNLTQYQINASTNQYYQLGIKELEDLLKKLPLEKTLYWPDQGEIISKLFDFYESNNEIKKSYETLNEGLREFPNNEYLLSRKFSALLNDYDIDQATKLAYSLHSNYPDKPTYLFILALALNLTENNEAENLANKFFETSHEYKDYIRMLLFYHLSVAGKNLHAEEMLMERWKTIDSSTWKTRLENNDINVWREMLIGYYLGKVPEKALIEPLIDSAAFLNHPFSRLSPLTGMRCEAYFYIGLKKGAEKDNRSFEKYMIECVGTKHRSYYEYLMAKYFLTRIRNK
jgi:hypothetical protein